MKTSKRRNIFPMKNWTSFLEEGKLDFQRRYNEVNVSNNYKRVDFEFIRTIGKGSFGRVYIARMWKNNKYYAIKIIDKMQIFKKNQIRHSLDGKKILQSLNFPFCVYLKKSFQDNSYLYLCLPFICGGEMFTHLKKLRRFEETLSKFYGAQVLLAFEYLHYCNMLYRDLKPENILIDRKGYLKLTDFGFCKVVMSRTYTVCGTPEYMAPEVLMQKGYGRSVDWWSYGVLLYEMTAGFGPFQDKKMMKVYQNVMYGKYYMPNLFSIELADLIENLLQVDVTRRFGNMKNGIKDIKEHRWFKDMYWNELFNGYLKAPYIPSVHGEGDTRNFDVFEEIRMIAAMKDYFMGDFEDF